MIKKNSVYAMEAKEYLRKRLVGQNVTCLFDYAHPDDPDSKYYTVYFKDSNIAVDILDNGYGRVTNHFDDEPRSREYQKLIYAQNRASKINKGIHCPPHEKPKYKLKDLTVKSDFQRSQSYLSFFKRAGRVSGVVEQVIGASRFKVSIPSENLLIIISLNGIFCDMPQKAIEEKNEKNENEKNENEKNVRKSFYEIYPISNSVNRGLHFVREKLYQRDVEITINDVDRRSGIFRGKVYFQGEDITISLLEEGYAMINVDTAANMEEYKIYKEAETIETKKEKTKKEINGELKTLQA